MYEDRQGRQLVVSSVEPGEALGREICGRVDGEPFSCDRIVFTRAWELARDPEKEDRGFLDRQGEALIRAVDGAATALSASSLTAPRERDLEDRLVDALIAEGVAVRRQFAVHLAGWQGRLGPVDLAVLDDDGGVSALLEVKLGGKELWNCAWDVAKLAVAHHEKVAPVSLLVAAAPCSAWEGGRSGTELFDSRTWDLETYLGRFGHSFAFWREDVANRPVQLPAELRIEQIATAEFGLGGTPWDVRIAAVKSTSSAMRRIRYEPVADVPARLPSPAGVPREVTAPTILSESAEPLKWLHDAAVVPPPWLLREGGSVTGLNLLGLVTEEGTLAEFDDDDAGTGGPHARWFSSASQRRAYVEARGWRELNSQAPDVMHVQAGSGLGSSFEISWDGRGLRLSTWATSSEQPHTYVIDPTNEDWRRLWRELDRIDAWSWAATYEPAEQVMDGHGWRVTITAGGRSCDSRGYMSYPGDHPPLRSSTTWSAFLLALHDLVRPHKLY